MIKNATGKSILKIRRVGGDFEIRIEDLSGKTLFVEWYRMKKPHKKTWAQIHTLFELIKKKIVMEEKK